MTIDNFNIFAPWFDNLSDQGDFFFVQVIQRKKECNIGSNNNVIKDYHFFDKKSFLNKKEEIVTLCKTFNARAYFWVNPRNCKQVQYEIIREALEAIECNSKKLFKCVSKAIGQRRNSNYKSKWIGWLSKQSYSFYIIHPVVLVGCTFLVEMMPVSPFHRLVIELCIGIPLCFAAGYVFRKIMNLIKIPI